MDEELIENFKIESEEHLEALEKELLSLENAENIDKNEISENLNSAFRAAHSLKGAAAFLGFKNITAVTHAMESILGNLRDTVEAPSAECSNLLFSGTDVLNELFEDLENSDQNNVKEILGKLNKYAAIPDADTQQKSSSAAVVAGSYKYVVITRETKVYTELKLLGETLSQKKNTDGKFEFIIESALELELLIMALGEYDCEVKEYIKPAKPKKVIKEKAVEKTAAVANNVVKKEKPAANALDSTVRVPVALLNELMSLAEELVLVRNQCLRWVSDNNDSKAIEISARLDTVTTELQTSILRTRMQPLDKVFSRLPRIVRDVSKVLEKNINLEIVGKEVEVDKTILESIVDPLTHLLRNSCDHGVELPADRAAKGKSEEGKVQVTAQQESGHIRITISDDGKGIDPEVIARSAVKKNMIEERELAHMSDQEKVSLIMMPGFSTAETVSNISGRGVGMDVVRSSIEKLGGTFEIKSEVGKGTEFVLSLPLTMAIIQSLVIAEGDYRYLIPRINLEEVVTLVSRDIHNRIKVVNGQEVLNYHSSLLQLVRLGEVFGSPTPFDTRKREEISAKYHNRYLQQQENQVSFDSQSLDIAVVRVGQKRFGLIIDKALETEEIVVKPLHPAQNDVKIFLGSTIMGDGATSLILDIDGISKHALSEIRYKEKESVREDSIIHSEASQKILVFKAAAEEQFALALSFIRRIYTINLKDIQHIGNEEFIQIGGKTITVARLTEVLGYKANVDNYNDEVYLIMPRFGSYNCGIIATAIEGIVNMIIDFDDTVVKQEGILGNVLIENRLTVFPDIYYICESVLGADVGDLSLKLNKEIQPKKVLVVEDTPFFRQLIKTYLNSERLNVDTACNGEEALELLVKTDYDLLLSDIEMPKMNGIELIKKVRSIDRLKSLPAISLTSLNTDSDRKMCIQAGFDNYLAKLNREEFHRSINSIFNN